MWKTDHNNKSRLGADKIQPGRSAICEWKCETYEVFMFCVLLIVDDCWFSYCLFFVLYFVLFCIVYSLFLLLVVAEVVVVVVVVYYLFLLVHCVCGGVFWVLLSCRLCGCLCFRVVCLLCIA